MADSLTTCLNGRASQEGCAKKQLETLDATSSRSVGPDYGGLLP